MTWKSVIEFVRSSRGETHPGLVLLAWAVCVGLVLLIRQFHLWPW